MTSLTEGPPDPVVRAFGLRGASRRLAGGQDDSFVVDGAVLKRVGDAAEAAWVQGLAQRLDPQGFRIARPVRAAGDAWVIDGWTASEFIPGLAPAAPDWDQVFAAGRRFADATEALGPTASDAEVLAARGHRWARADRCAWGEEDIDLAGVAGSVLFSLRDLTDAPTGERRIIHADLTGNVHVDPWGTPVILDLSPYLRPLRWADAIVVADAVTWWTAPLDLATSFAASDEGRDLLARALIFRLVAEQLGGSAGDPNNLEPYQSVLRHLTA